MNALVVDDSHTNLLIVKSFLERMGYDATSASNAKDGIALYYEQTFDVVIMDFRMPFINGAEAISVIRDFEKSDGRQRAKIIAVSASESKALADAMLECGADLFLQIPFLFDDLRVAIESA